MGERAPKGYEPVFCICCEGRLGWRRMPTDSLVFFEPEIICDDCADEKWKNLR